MEGFQKKTLKTSRGYTYTYYTVDGDKSLPTLFFQHGWPDQAELWEGVAERLRSTKYPMIIPDMLGYGGTDKPTDPAEYRWDKMTQDLIEIVDKEEVSKIISVGHDWGSACASRLYNYHPDRVVGLVNINVAYSPLSRSPFDLDAVNALTEKFLGRTILAYWHLFTAPDGPEILKKHSDRLYHAMHGVGPTITNLFVVRDALRNYLTGDAELIELRPYAADPKTKQAFIDRFNRDGFEAPQCWYHATRSNHQHESDKNLPEDRNKVNVPSLYMGGKDDGVCTPEMMFPTIQQGLLPHLTQEPQFDAAHFTPAEVPDKIADTLEPWLKKNFAQ